VTAFLEYGAKFHFAIIPAALMSASKKILQSNFQTHEQTHEQIEK
jgi:hypothetical protein